MTSFEKKTLRPYRAHRRITVVVDIGRHSLIDQHVKAKVSINHADKINQIKNSSNSLFTCTCQSLSNTCDPRVVPFLSPCCII